MWSIGIYGGDSPFNLDALPGTNNPVLTRDHISDVSAAFVADPFMILVDNVWHMFFEVLNQKNKKGEIGLATSATGKVWVYRQIVLREPFHLSYPYVFEWNGEYYMTPETLGANAVSLYKAIDFPLRWSCVGHLIQGPCADPSVFRYDGKWWMFGCSTPYQHDTLRLYFAKEISGAWREHPASPIIQSNRRNARPAGRVLFINGNPIRFAQDCLPRYGTQLRAFEISKLSVQRYAEHENRHSPVLRASGAGWNCFGMHHLDAHLVDGGRWIACVDGSSERSDAGPD
jgi:hypothetical protein